MLRPSLLLLLSGTATAAGLDVPLVGTTRSGPVAHDLAAVHHNPAMLGFRTESGLLFGGGIVAGRIGYERERLGTYPFEDTIQLRDPIPPEDVDRSKTGPAEPVVARPLAPYGGLFAGGPIWRDRVSLAGGLTAPYAAALAFPEDGPQRWALQEASILVGRATLSVAGRPHPQVSIGGGLSYVFGLASLQSHQDFAGLDLMGDALSDPPVNQPNDLGARAPTTVRETEVFERPFLLRNAVAHGVTFQLGIAGTVGPVTLGASYDHGTRLAFRGPFQLDLDDPFFTDDLASSGLGFAPLVEGEGQLVLRTPMRARLGVGVAVTEAVDVDLTLEWVRWSQVQAFEITLQSADLAQPELGIGDTTTAALPRRWRDSATAQARVSGRIGLATLTGLLGYQSPASPDETVDVSSPDGHRLLGGLGARFAVTPTVALHLDGVVSGILPRTVSVSDYDLGNGRYTLTLGTAMLHVEAAFPRRPERAR